MQGGKLLQQVALVISLLSVQLLLAQLASPSGTQLAARLTAAPESGKTPVEPSPPLYSPPTLSPSPYLLEMLLQIEIEIAGKIERK